MPELENATLIVQNPFVFDEDFCIYTQALNALKQKHPRAFLQLHEYAATLLELHDGVTDIVDTAP